MESRAAAAFCYYSSCVMGQRQHPHWILHQISTAGPTFVAALAAVIFVFVGLTPHVHAQAQKPDFAVTSYASRAFLRGTHLYLEWENATGVWMNRRPWAIGFEWLDARGVPMGERRVRRFDIVPGEGKAIMDSASARPFIDSARGQDVMYRGLRFGVWPTTYTESLATFLENRPDAAAALRVTLDVDSAIEEEDETNNVVVFQADRPDVLVAGAAFVTPNHLRFLVQNIGSVRVPTPFRTTLQWLDRDGHTIDDPRGKVRWVNRATLESNDSAVFDSASRSLDVSHETKILGIYPSSSSERLTWFLENRPNGAALLRIVADGGGSVTEADEENNAVTISVPLPDLVIRDASLDDDHLTFAFTNDAATYHRDVFDISFQWVHADGSPADERYWTRTVSLDPKQTRQFDSSGETVFFDAGRREGLQSLGIVIRRRPEGAAALRLVIDEGNRIVESNEDNNVVLIALPGAFVAELDTPEKPSNDDVDADIATQPESAPALPDFVLQDATLSGDTLSFSYANIGKGDAMRQPPLSFRFEWLDASGARAEDGLAWHDRDAGVLFAGTSYDFSSANQQAFSARGALSLRAILERPPKEAAQLRVTIDGPNVHREADETNNSLLFVIPRPDFSIASAALQDGQLRVAYNHRDARSSIARVSFWFEWVDANGTRIGDLRWSDTEFSGGASPRTVTWSVASQLESVNGAEPFAAFLTAAPTNATHFKLAIDGPDAIVEADESNNTTLVEKPVPPMPDLALADVRITMTAPNPRIDYVVENHGEVEAPNTDIGLQWVDARSVAVGPPHAFEVLQRLRAGGKEKRTLPFADVGQGDEAARGRYLLFPPESATQLQLILDPKNILTELDELNNTTVVPRPLNVPLADLTFIASKFSQDVFSVQYQNVGPVHAGYFKTLSTWFEWVDANGDRVGELVWHDGDSLDPKYSVILEASSPVSSATRTRFPLREFLKDTPEGATHLKVLVDGPNNLIESDETNNVILLEKPKPKLPDLTVSAASELNAQRLSLGVENRGQEPIRGHSLWFEWVDADGARVGDLFWYDLPKQTILAGQTSHFALGTTVPLSARVLFRESASGPIPATIADLLSNPPSTAAHLKVHADGPNAIRESDETNNVTLFARPIVPLPDLTLREVSRTPQVITMIIVNAGTEAARAPEWEFRWIGQDGSVLATSQRITYSIGWPKAGQSSPFELPYQNGREDAVFRFLKHPPAGAAALEIVLDPANIIAELDEQNNTARVDLGKLPDLVVAASEVRDAQLSITVKNGGVGASIATDIWLMWFGARGALPSSAATDLPAIAAGASETVRVPLAGDTEANRILRDPPKDGTRLRVFLDGSRRVDELDEQNNDAWVDRGSLAQRPSTLPDLTYNGRPYVSNFAPYPPELVVSIKNNGEAATGPFVWQMQWLDRSGKELGSSYRAKHPGLPPGSFYGALHDARDSYALGVSMGDYVTNIPTGAATLDILLDPDRALTESDEENNHATLAASVLAMLGNKRPTADAGEDIVERDDDGDGKETTRFYSRDSTDADGKIVSWVWTAAGREVAKGQYPYWWNVPVGVHEVTLTVTDDGGLTATDTVKVTVEPKPATPPDLVLDVLTLTPSIPKPGDIVFFSVRTVNRGLVSVGQVSSLSLGIDLANNRSIDVRLAQPVLKDLGPGEAQTWDVWKDARDVNYHWKATAGTHRIIACADASGYVRESDEQNNCKEVVVTVEVPAPKPDAPTISGPDLTMLSPLVQPTAPTVGSTVTFVATVKNQGTDVAGPSEAWVHLDELGDGVPEMTPEIEAIPQLAPGGTTTVRWEATWWQAIRGTHRVEFCTDVSQLVREASETNNCATISFTIR